jgi:WD40 repeat protein
VYRMPDFKSHLVLVGHRAAVNTIALSSTRIMSASGDKSVRIWDIESGREAGVLENHHSRGCVTYGASHDYFQLTGFFDNYGRIAAIDAEYPVVLTGSSDQHIRLYDVQTEQGWSTCTKFDPQAAFPLAANDPEEDVSASDAASVCQNCGSVMGEPLRGGVKREDCSHTGLVRSVALNSDFVVSGSYVSDTCLAHGFSLHESP